MNDMKTKKKKMAIFALFLFTLIFCISCKHKKVGSTNGELPLSKKDSALYSSAESLFSRGKFDESNDTLIVCIDIYKQKNNQLALANAYTLMGLNFYRKGDYSNDLENSMKAYVIYSSLSRKYLSKSNIRKDSITLSLQQDTSKKQALADSIKESHLYLEKCLTTVHLNLGSAYERINCKDNCIPSAIEHWKKALNIAIRIKDKPSIRRAYNNLGNIHVKTKDYSTALFFYWQALSLNQASKDEDQLGSNYINVGEVYDSLRRREEAILYFNKALHIKRKVGDQVNTAECLNGLGYVYLEEKSYSQAKSYFEEAVQILRNVNERYLLPKVLRNLSLLHQRQGNFHQAIYYRDRIITLLDSTAEQVKEPKLMELQHKLGEARKNKIIEGLSREKEVQQKEIERQRTIIWIVAIIVSVFLVLISLIWYLLVKRSKEKQLLKIQKAQLTTTNSLLSEQKAQLTIANDLLSEQKAQLTIANDLLSEQKAQLQKQKDELEYQKKQITDSIDYAKRIQDALLPSQDTLSECLPYHTLFYRPKDIVSGDFYWVDKTESKLIIAVGDCTGHGVAGAFITTFGLAHLDEYIKKNKMSNPVEILQRLRKDIIRHFTGMDVGMDIAICTIDIKTNVLEYSGANIDLHIIYNGVHGVNLADKMSICLEPFEKAQKSFKSQTIIVKPGMTFCLTSDGFAHQFGGASGKKFGREAFEKVLFQQVDSFEETMFLNAYNVWTTTSEKIHEQIDDICVLCFRL